MQLTDNLLRDKTVAIDRLIVLALCCLVLSPEIKSESAIQLGSMDDGHEDLIWKADSQEFTLQVFYQFTCGLWKRFTDGEVY